jgi:hypothetical protein
MSRGVVHGRGQPAVFEAPALGVALALSAGMVTRRAFELCLILGLPACGQAIDINGTYNGTMSRSQGCGNPPPTSASAQVQIVDTASEHAGHILGAQPCDFDFTVTDYGGIGNVSDVRAGCAFQPPGTVFAGGEFSPKQFTLSWTTSAGDAGAGDASDGGDGGVSSCLVTDSWSLTR